MQRLYSPYQNKVEKCGVVGVFSKTGKNVAPLIYSGLLGLQHRGQDSAGFSLFNGTNIITKKGKGLVGEVFNESDLLVEGSVGIGHTRYRTVGLSEESDIQPFVDQNVAIAHNGQLTNYEELKKRLKLKDQVLTSSVDSELILHLIKKRITSNVDNIVRAVMHTIDGSYSVVALLENRLLVFRDRYGLRPLVYGENEDFIAFASESSALDLMHIPYRGDVTGGEYVLVDKNGLERKWIEMPDPHHCMFEYVYFARPDSFINGLNVFEVRYRLGERLAEESSASADIVIPIPETARIAAQGFSSKSGIPVEEGLLKNKVALRTFIMPQTDQRKEAIKLKLIPVPSVIRGRRVVLIDDSIVRGSTTKEVVQMVRQAGAREVHVRVACPPIKSPCFYGVDISTHEELIASQRTLKEIRKHIGADSLAYLSLEGLGKVIGLQLCTGCLDGNYPTAHGQSLAITKK